MKMETRLAATRPGIIKSVFVSEGELVESGRPMFEFESE
jgi:biotin carboxyl carrier protein